MLKPFFTSTVVPHVIRPDSWDPAAAPFEQTCFAENESSKWSERGREGPLLALLRRGSVLTCGEPREAGFGFPLGSNLPSNLEEMGICLSVA